MSTPQLADAGTEVWQRTFSRAQVGAERVAFAEDSSGPFSGLPDDVLREVLTLLQNARHVALSAAVCKRWNAVARQVHSLHFGQDPRDMPPPAYEKMVTGMILRSSELRSLHIANTDCAFADATVEAWLRHAGASLEDFSLLDLVETEAGLTRRLAQLALCPKLTSLELYNSEILVPPQPPPGQAYLLPRLQQLSLFTMELSDRALDSLVTLAPVLRELTLVKCWGLRTVRLQSPSLMALTLADSQDSIESVVLLMPQLRTLTVSECEALTALEAGQLERCKVGLPSRGKMLLDLRTGGGLRELRMGGAEWEWAAITPLLRANPGLSFLSLHLGPPTRGWPACLYHFAHALKHLKQLDLTEDVALMLVPGISESGAKMNGPLLPSLVEVRMTVTTGTDESALVLYTLVRCCPALTRMVIDSRLAWEDRFLYFQKLSAGFPWRSGLLLSMSTDDEPRARQQ